MADIGGIKPQADLGSLARYISLILITSLSCLHTRTSRGEEPTKVPASHFDPVVRKIEGWTVHIDPSLIGSGDGNGDDRSLVMLANTYNEL